MIKQMLIPLFLFIVITIAPCESPAQDSCSYCGIWVPWVKEYDSTYTSSDRLTVTEQTLALPGCSPTKSTQLFLTNKLWYENQETADRGQLKAILLIEEPINCASPTFVPQNGAFVEIKLWPGRIKNSERLELAIFAPTTLEEIKASYTYQLIPTPAGQMQMKKSPPSPKKVGGWRFIREKYNPCDEGTGHGALICAYINHKKADENLNTEWIRLLGVIPPDKKKELISTQKKWNKACSAKCDKEYGDKGSVSWGVAYETFCLAEEKNIRSRKFRDLYECIQSGKLDCPNLENKP